MGLGSVGCDITGRLLLEKLGRDLSSGSGILRLDAEVERENHLDGFRNEPKPEGDPARGKDCSDGEVSGPGASTLATLGGLGRLSITKGDVQARQGSRTLHSRHDTDRCISFLTQQP